MQRVLRLGKRIAIAVAGVVVSLAGVIMLVIPGPGILTIVLGLGILSLEFETPRVWLHRLKEKGVAVRDKFLHRQ